MQTGKPTKRYHSSKWHHQEVADRHDHIAPAVLAAQSRDQEQEKRSQAKERDPKQGKEIQSKQQESQAREMNPKQGI